MIPSSERALKRTILAWLRANDAWATSVVAGPLSARGIPDIIGCYRGRFIAIEVKSPKLKYPERALTPQQRRTLNAITLARGHATCVYSLAPVELLIDAIDREMSRG